MKFMKMVCSTYKAAFESFLTIKDPVESKKLDVFAKVFK